MVRMDRPLAIRETQPLPPTQRWEPAFAFCDTRANPAKKRGSSKGDPLLSDKLGRFVKKSCFSPQVLLREVNERAFARPCSDGAALPRQRLLPAPRRACGGSCVRPLPQPLHPSPRCDAWGERPVERRPRRAGQREAQQKEEPPVCWFVRLSESFWISS